MLRLLHRLVHALSRRLKQVGFWRAVSLRGMVAIAGLAIALLSLWAFAELADEVLEQETQAFDRQILEWLYRWHTPILTRIMVSITTLGNITTLVLVSVLSAGWLLWRKLWLRAITLAIAASGAGLLNYSLKVAFGRARPHLWKRVVDVGVNSFPSGHAMISLVIYGLLGYWLAQYFRTRRPLVFTITVILIGLIGFSRLYLGVHWPTDVIAGYAAGLVWLITCVLILEIRELYR